MEQKDTKNAADEVQILVDTLINLRHELKEDSSDMDLKVIYSQLKRGTRKYIKREIEQNTRLRD